jgi:hypothetical protein
MGIWADFQRNQAARGGTQAPQPQAAATPDNAALIAREKEDFPTFTQVADYWGGESNEPRFQNFTNFVKMFGGYDEGFNGVQQATYGSPEDSPIAGGHGNINLGGRPAAVPVVPEAGDFGPGEGMDFENDFTDEDIVDMVAPKAPGKAKMTKPQAKKRAAVKKAVKPAAPVKNPYSKNPFAKNFSPSAFRDGLGSQRGDVKHIPGAAAYEAKRGYTPNRKVKQDIMDLF